VADNFGFLEHEYLRRLLSAKVQTFLQFSEKKTKISSYDSAGLQVFHHMERSLSGKLYGVRNYSTFKIESKNLPYFLCRFGIIA